MKKTLIWMAFCGGIFLAGDNYLPKQVLAQSEQTEETPQQIWVDFDFRKDQNNFFFPNGHLQEKTSIQIETLDRLIDENPDNIEARVFRGYVDFHYFGDYAQAKEDFQYVFNSENPEAEKWAGVQSRLNELTSVFTTEITGRLIDVQNNPLNGMAAYFNGSGWNFSRVKKGKITLLADPERIFSNQTPLIFIAENKQPNYYILENNKNSDIGSVVLEEQSDSKVHLVGFGGFMITRVTSHLEHLIVLSPNTEFQLQENPEITLSTNEDGFIYFPINKSCINDDNKILYKTLINSENGIYLRNIIY